jgi:hypothetical protein
MRILNYKYLLQPLRQAPQNQRLQMNGSIKKILSGPQAQAQERLQSPLLITPMQERKMLKAQRLQMALMFLSQVLQP